METTTTQTAFRTRQEIFDIAYRGLAAQGFKQSLTPNGESCAYRGEHGRKCAVGFLLDDEAYTYAFEGVSAANPGVLRRARISNALSAFARDLQKCHDLNPCPSDMSVGLVRFASRHGLTIPQLDNAEASA